MRIDSHLHVFLSQREDPQREVSELVPAEREAPVELLLETMAAHGIDRAVLVPLGSERAYVARCIAGDPDRCVADESLHADPERELRERVAAGLTDAERTDVLGGTAARIFPQGWGR